MKDCSESCKKDLLPKDIIAVENPDAKEKKKQKNDEKLNLHCLKPKLKELDLQMKLYKKANDIQNYKLRT